MIINPFILFPAPVNTVAPAVTPTTAGIEQTLTGTDGTWTGSPTFTYQWKRGGVNIPGATASTYITKIEDDAANITFHVTGTNAGGSTTASSNSCAVTAQFPFTMLADMGLWLDTSNTKTMFLATSTTEVVYEPTDGQRVGLMLDRSPNAHIIRTAVSAALMPQLQTSGSRNSYLQFDAANSNRQAILNSNVSLKRIHGANPVVCISFWMNLIAGNSSLRIIMSNNNNSTANVGFTISRNASNKIVMAVTNGSTTVWSVTSVANVTNATGWVPVIINLNGAGTGTGRLIIGAIEDQTFDISAGSTSNAFGNLFFGTRSSLAEFWPGQLSDIIFLNRIMSAGEITSYKAYNPSRKSINISPILSNFYDFNDASNLYSDTGATTTVVNNDTVRVVKNKVTENFGDNQRRLTSVDVPTSPVYKTAALNGLNCIEYTGADAQNLDFETALNGQLGGKFVLLLIGKNDDATDGSHFIRGGDQYIALTGSSYATGSTTNPYFAVHPSPVGGTANVFTTKNPLVDDCKILVVRRDGDEISQWNGNKAKNTVTTTNPISFVDMGIDDFPSANWDFDGKYGLLKYWVGYMNDADIEKIIDDFNTTYGI